MGKHNKKEGRPIGQVEGVHIFQKETNEKVKLDNGKFKIATKSTDIALFQGRKEIQKGFKNKEIAMEAAKKIVADKKEAKAQSWKKK